MGFYRGDLFLSTPNQGGSITVQPILFPILKRWPQMCKLFSLYSIWRTSYTLSSAKQTEASSLILYRPIISVDLLEFTKNCFLKLKLIFTDKFLRWQWAALSQLFRSLNTLNVFKLIFCHYLATASIIAKIHRWLLPNLAEAPQLDKFFWKTQKHIPCH